jgi:ornithine cyclodeaminase
MARRYARAEIERVIDPRELIDRVAAAFIAYSSGRAVVPPVGELLFEDPPGDCHIKYGALRGEATFTVKIATGFPRNLELGKSTSNGVVLVFSARTGELECILDDEGFLTDARTAAAGALAARLLAPAGVECIGIVGSGIQARMQLDYLRHVLPTRRALIYARRAERARAVAVPGFELAVADSLEALAARCRLIVTTTASRELLLSADLVRPGTHVTAVGADSAGKQELDPRLFARAAIRAVDSLSQCSAFGDAAHALAAGLVRADALVELGSIAAAPGRYPRGAADITIADLTGVAVQDVAAAALARERLS